LIGDFEKGGLKMIDIESYFISLKASWVSRLADSKFSNWKLIPLKYLNVFGKIWLIFKMNIDVKKREQFLNNIPEFYKNVLTSWIKTDGGDHEKNKLLIFNKTDHHSITEILLKSDIKRHEPINLRIKLTPLI
jgi:hypothetical protein